MFFTHADAFLLGVKKFQDNFNMYLQIIFKLKQIWKVCTSPQNTPKISAITSTAEVKLETSGNIFVKLGRKKKIKQDEL